MRTLLLIVLLASNTLLAQEPEAETPAPEPIEIEIVEVDVEVSVPTVIEATLEVAAPKADLQVPDLGASVELEEPDRRAWQWYEIAAPVLDKQIYRTGIYGNELQRIREGFATGQLSADQARQRIAILLNAISQ